MDDEQSLAELTDDECLALAKQLFVGGKNIFRRHRGRHSSGPSSQMNGAPAVLRGLTNAEGEDTPRSPSELAELCRVTNARMANILRVLEEKELITRTQSQEDKRRYEVRLTETGHAEVECRKREMMSEGVRFVRAFGEEDTRELIRLVNKIGTILDASDEGRSASTAVGETPTEGRQ